MSRHLTDVIAIIDMDGFFVNKKFFYRELGVLKVGNAAAESFFFDFSLRWGELSPRDQKACCYVQKYIHKLPFRVPTGVDALSTFPKLISELRQNSNSVIAYKGGHIERDLLAGLNIPAINLEDFGCPKLKS